jgi:hypothetical protein
MCAYVFARMRLKYVTRYAVADDLIIDGSARLGEIKEEGLCLIFKKNRPPKLFKRYVIIT